MTDPTFTAPSQNAGSTLPFDALVYQNIIDAITRSVMHRAPIALTVTGTTVLAGTSGLTMTEYKTGNWFWWIAPNACTGPTSLGVDTMAQKNIRNRSGLPLASGAWDAGDLVAAVYEGTSMRLVGSFDFAAALASGGMAPGFSSGLAMATNSTDANNDIDVASGFARSEDNTRDIILTAPLTKRMDAAWLAGTGNGAVLQSANLAGTITITTNVNVAGAGTAFLTDFIVGDVIQSAAGQARRVATISSNTAMTVESAWTSGETGVTYKRGGKARNSCYRVFVIRRDSDGLADVAVSTRDTPVDLPAGWSQYFRFDYQLTDSAGNNRPFDQFAHLKVLRTAILKSSASYNGGAGGAVFTETHTTLLPPSVLTNIQISGYTTSGPNTLEGALFPAAQAAATGVSQFFCPAGPGTVGLTEVLVPLNSASAFKSTVTIGVFTIGTVNIYLRGWFDDRGAGIGGVSANPNNGRVAWPADITPSALAADTNNWAPAGIGAATVVRVDYGADGRLLTGLVAGADGDIVELDNIGTTYGVLKNQSAASAVANRFAFNGDVVHWPGQTVRVRYDNVAGRWRTTRADVVVTQAPGDNSTKPASTAYADAVGIKMGKAIAAAIIFGG